MNLGNIFKKDSRITESTSVRNVENLIRAGRGDRILSDMRSMAPGQTIQGEIVSRNGNSVQIALAGDLLVNARLDQNVSVLPGQSMCFEIMTNNGSMLSLSPLYANMANGETIQRALNEAGLMQTKENMQMVSLMMEEGMPINRDSILNMSRLFAEFPDQDPLAMIQMTRLQIPVTPEGIEQFEQYRSAQHQLANSAQDIADGLPEVCAELLAEGKTEEAVKLYLDLVQIFGENMPETDAAQAQTTQTAENIVKEETVLPENPEGQPVQQEDAEGVQGSPANAAVPEAEIQEGQPRKEALWKEIGNLLKELGAEEEFAQAVKDQKLPAGEVLKQAGALLADLAADPARVSPEKMGLLRSLLGKDGLLGLLKEEMLEQWLLQPEEVADREKVEQLYERIREQSGRMQEALDHAGKAAGSLGKSVQNVQNNLEFMNQLNHVFTYIQLPLKMAGNKAHGDLYVYTNKKSLAAKDGNVSAFLHLDMEHLGSVDVYVTMKNQKVNTNFTLEDEDALNLIAAHIDILEKRLADRGYELNARMEKKSGEAGTEEGGVMQTMLEQSKNISVLGHTSFDMRA